MRDNDSQKIIVVGIPKTMDDAGLSELFSGFGTVADAKVVLDVNNKQPRGFGFVTFTSGAAMRKAIQDMNKKVVEGRTLNVRQLVPKDKFQAEKSKDENAPDAASRPCWLLRKGKCTKGDLCPFSHETKNGEFGSCFEFMQTGECKRGDKCIFSHKVAGADGQQEENGAEASDAANPAQTEKIKAETKKLVVKNETAGSGEQKQRVCYAFQKGKCHRGKKCLFLHEKVPEMANDVPVVVVKKDGATPATKRGEFEVVTQAEAGKKRGRANSHDDGEDDDDEEDDMKEEKPAPKQQRTSVPAVSGSQKSDGPQRGLAAAHRSTSLSAANKGKPSTTTATQASPAKTPYSAEAAGSKRPAPAPAVKPYSAPSAAGDKRPRNEDAPKKSFTDKRPRFDSSGRPFEKSEHPAAKRIFERENGGPSKYAPQPGSSAPMRKEDKWKSRNNKNALQRLNKKSRPPGYQPPQPHQHEGERPPQPKREKVDMGAAFDSDDDRKPRGGGKPRVVDKAALKANREKLQQERRAKRDAKKTALGRLKTQEKVEL